jgi:fatty acid synthase
VAFDAACRDIRAGTIDRAIVGGLSLTLDPAKNATFNAFNMLSPDGRCYSFDTRANGYCRSEAVVAVVLESSRVARPGSACAQVLGTAVNNDGKTPQGITFPSATAQEANARAALSGIPLDSIGYIEAHGTGTTAGDRTELAGLAAIFPPGTAPIPIGSVKSSMGHAEGASGLVSVVKCLLSFEKRRLFPNHNFERTEHAPLLDGTFSVVTESRAWVPANVCISNYGFGGTNAFVVLGPGTATYAPDDTETCVSFANHAGQQTDGLYFSQQIALGNHVPFSH